MNGRDLTRASWRLGLQTAVLLMTCLLIVGATIFVVFVRASTSDAKRELRSVTAHVDQPGEAPRGVFVVVLARGQRAESPGLPAWMPDEEALTATARDGRIRENRSVREGHDYLIRTQRVGDRVTQAILDYEDVEAARSRVLVALLEAGGVGAVLSALMAAWLARRAMRPLAETMAMQRRFIADASHELRTPLTLLSTRVQLLARRLDRGPVERVEGEMAGVLGDAARLGGILDDLLIASDTRRTTVHEPVDPSTLVADVVASAEATAAERGLALRVECPDGLRVLGSDASLRRAVTALLDNALDHATAEVRVEVHARGRQLRVDVVDDGPGIPADVAPRIFDRFASGRDQEEQGRRRHYGIGLALVADVAAAHGGRVSVGQQVGGGGAVLTLWLPTRST